MAVTHLGSKTVGAINIGVGLALPAIAAMLADLASRITALNAQVTANLSLIATLPDPLALAGAIADAATAAVTAIADIIASIPAPLLDANATLGLDLVGLLGLKVKLQAILDTLNAAVSAGGVHAFSVDSTNAALGAELSSALAGGLPGGGVASARVRGVLLLTELPAAFAALSSVLLTG